MNTFNNKDFEFIVLIFFIISVSIIWTGVYLVKRFKLNAYSIKFWIILGMLAFAVILIPFWVYLPVSFNSKLSLSIYSVVMGVAFIGGVILLSTKLKK